MYFVGVVFHEDSKKIYWFKLSYRLFASMMNGEGKIGDTVLVQTVVGEQQAVVKAVMEMKDEQSMQSVFPSVTLPMCNVLALQTPVCMDKIRIPKYVQESKPDPAKIAKRVAEWYSGNGFKTLVTFTQSHELKDGYTAYLVAKMFGQPTLRGFVI